MAHQVKDAVIRLRALDGTWETAGTDRARGVFAENLELDWDGWGPKTASFDLKRSPRTPWPDIAAFTDVEIEIAAVQVWKGRVRETPARDGADRSMNVQCDGLQAHLDDDVLVPAYVHTRLSDYRDVRSNLTATLTRFKTNGTVQADRGAIVLGFPNGAAVATNDCVGVLIDLGPSALGKRIVLDYSNQGVAAGFYSVFATGVDTPADLFTGGDNITGSFDPATAALTKAGSSTNGRRYIGVVMYRTGAAATEAADRLIRITGMQTFTATAYESGNLSILKASQVIPDALTRGTVLLDPDRTLIATTSFSIPDLFTTEQRTPREVIDAANAYHDYVTKVDERGRPVFQPKASAPLVEVGAHTALEIEDSSANSGNDIYNRVLVTGQSAAGDPVVVQRTAGQQTGATLIPVSTPVPDNPSFATNTASWTVTNGLITRDTVTFHSSPASGKFTAGSGGGANLLTTLTGTFEAGVTYALQFAYKADVASRNLLVYFGSTADVAAWTITPTVVAVTSSFGVHTVTWTPAVDTSGGSLRVAMGGIVAAVDYIDSLALFRAGGTLVDRRGFLRTKVLQVSSMLDTSGAIGAQLGDTFLSNHKTAQFKGTARIVGPTAREILTGRSIQPEQLGMRTGELLRFSDRIDPDTGAVGRDGRIAAVKYRLAEDDAMVTIDNTSQNFESLLARLAVIQGSGQ